MVIMNQCKYSNTERRRVKPLDYYKFCVYELVRNYYILLVYYFTVMSELAFNYARA